MITTAQIFNQIKNQIKSDDFSHKAAVFIPLIRDEYDQLNILFEVRAATLRWQPGDICLPGGKMEARDHSAIDTAIREMIEELGLPAEKIKIYGQLPAFISAVGFEIYPVVGELTCQQFRLNKDEVAQTFTVPLEWFIKNPPRKTAMEVAHKPATDFPFELLPNQAKDWQKRSQHDIYVYHYQNFVIWGLTAHIIQLFLHTINS